MYEIVDETVVMSVWYGNFLPLVETQLV